MSQRDDERYGEVVSTRYPIGLLRELDRIIDDKDTKYLNRHDFIREAIRRLLDEIEKKKTYLKK